MELPSLENLAYRAGDDGDHLDAGHCAWLGGADKAGDRSAMIDQYGNALRALVDAAVASGDGWSLSRPILFVVHQLCELSLDLALHRAKRNGRNVKVAHKRHPHSLEDRMEAAVVAGVYDDMTAEDQQWCRRFITEIVPLTGHGFPGRYPDRPVVGTLKLEDVWCCINPVAIRDATLMFAGLTIAEATEVRSEPSEMSGG